MNERMRESLSALMDDEANELELERVLSQVGSNAELRQTWSRYNLAHNAAQGDQLAHLDWDISGRVQSALASPGVSGSSVSTASDGYRNRFLRPLISVGVAASVAFTVVIGGQQLADVDNRDAYAVEQSVPGNPSPVGMLNIAGAVPVQASFGTDPAVPQLQPAVRTAYQDLAEQRLRKYMQLHAEQAALNSPQGLVPYARVPEIRE
jgi:sigma-E factor negative regulatory protein RseA